MTLIEALVLGTTQGLTEFLPVSSSGHLILVRDILGMAIEHALAVDAVLQLATALAVVMYFRKDLMRLARSCINLVYGTPDPQDRTLLFALGVGTIPAVVLGLLLEETMDTTFRNPHLVALVLVLGSILFVAAEYVAKRYTHPRDLTLGKGLVIGLFQSLALVPGMSRSGATIVGGLVLGLTREDAARFGFLLSIPIVVGSGSKKLIELGESGLLAADWFPLILASLAAFLSGLAAIHLLLRFVRSHSLHVFALYRVLLALVVLAFL